MQLSKKLLCNRRRDPFIYVNTALYPINIEKDNDIAINGMWMGSRNSYEAQQQETWVPPTNIEPFECFILSPTDEGIVIDGLSMAQLGNELRAVLQYHSQYQDDYIQINSLSMLPNGELRAILQQHLIPSEDGLDINSLVLLSGTLEDKLIIYGLVDNLSFGIDVNGLFITSATM